MDPLAAMIVVLSRVGIHSAEKTTSNTSCITMDDLDISPADDFPSGASNHLICPPAADLTSNRYKCIDIASDVNSRLEQLLSVCFFLACCGRFLIE